MESIAAQPYHYRMVECLGEGLNSCVYRAFKESSAADVKFEVALKILKSANLDSLWRNELERLMRVKSRHCVILHGWEVIEGAPALVLEYVRGVTLDELVRSGSLSRENIECIYSQAYRGLQDIARVDLYHGDLNLENIMVDVTGTVKLVDFGFTNGRRDRFITPKYAAPALLMGGTPTLETDIFSLKAICAEIEPKHLRPNRAVSATVETPHDDESSVSDLAEKVQKIIRMRESQRVKTNVYAIKKPRRFFTAAGSTWTAICAAFLFFSLLSRGDSGHEPPRAPARIVIRTAHWVKISIDNRDLGFAPVDVSVSASRPAHIHWLGANGSGERTVLLTPGKTEILTDRFFSPNST